MDASFGGTDILKPIKYVFKQKTDAQKLIFLLTDGSVCNTNEIVECIQKNC